MKRNPEYTMSIIAAVVAMAFVSGCGGSDDDTVQPIAAAAVSVPYTGGAATTSNAVAYWNRIATDTINVAPATTGTAEEQRPIILTDLATVHVAIYDAVIAITGTHRAFAVSPATPAAGASQEAAVAAAAYSVLKGLFPSRSANYQSAYDAYIAALPAGDARTVGIALGNEVAAAVLARRANDGRSTAVTYTPGTTPGNFRGMNPVGTFNRFVTPFALTSASQFRSAPPPALDSAAYTADFEEVRMLGGSVSTARTGAQLEAARFHTENPALLNTRNLRQFAMDSRSTAENARLMALLFVAVSDATNACFETKYFYAFWRPTSAITLADTDGNPATAQDAAWTPVLPTPNHPEYPAAHMCVYGAATAAIKGFFGTNQVSFSFGSNATATVRSYATTNDLLDEILLARIHGGMHFRNSGVQGGVLGTNVGEFVTKNYFQPR